MPTTRPLSPLQEAAVTHITQKLFDPSKWFSICAVSELAKIFDVPFNPTDWPELRTFHCVNWKSMPVEAKDEIVIALQALFPVYLAGLDELHAAVGSSTRTRVPTKFEAERAMEYVETHEEYATQQNPTVRAAQAVADAHVTGTELNRYEAARFTRPWY